MLKVKLRCENVTEVKIAKCLSTYGKNFQFYFKIKTIENAVEAEFELNSQSSLNELTRRLRHIKNIRFNFSEIEKVAAK